jgi:hypothetical protein
MSNNDLDGITNYNGDDDFPDYANEQNKELNEIVSLNAPQWLLIYHIL